MSIWFVTPAWRRFALSEVCFDQRARVIAALAKKGVEAHCVVIADDDNLDIARSFGFDTVERDNEWLGRKFNDGMEYAGKHGADWIVPIGSDSWVVPDYFLPLPSSQVTRTSRLYCAVTEDKLAQLAVRTPGGAGPYMIHRARLSPGFRPARDQIKRGVDGSTIAGIGHMEWRGKNLHPFQYIGFRGTPHITRFDKLVRRWGVRQHSDPWALLARYYPADLIPAVRAALRSDALVAA